MTILNQQKPVREQTAVADCGPAEGDASAAGNSGADKSSAGKSSAGKSGADKSEGHKGKARKGVAPSAEVLLGRYRRKRSCKIRNILVERFRLQVEAIARTLALRLPPCVDVQDLTHAGLWGLMQAVDNFRPERGSLFLPYMKHRVRGAMLDELRNMDYLPRLYRQRLKAREEARNDLRSRLSRDPSDAELAAELGVTETRLRQSYSDLPAVLNQSRAEGIASHGFSTLGRDAELSGFDANAIENLPDHALENPIEALNRQELLVKIESSLQPIEWTVLRMHYLEGMSGKEVAGKLRLSAARICQIHLRVLSRLKTRWASYAS